MAIEDISDWIAHGAATGERFCARVAETVDLYGLKEHPGWDALKNHFELGSESFSKNLAVRLMAGEQVNQREIDYLRGFIDAARAILKYPEAALSNVEESAKRGWAAHVSQEYASRVAAESPYIVDDPQEVT